MKMLAAMLFLVLVSVSGSGTGVLGEKQEVDYEEVDYEEFQSKLYLYKYNKTEQEQPHKGSDTSLLEIGVTWAGMTGPGCFLIYEKENFCGHYHRLEGSIHLEFLEGTTVRSYKFLSGDCTNVPVCPGTDAGIVIGVTLGLLVGLVLVLLLGFVYCKRQ